MKPVVKTEEASKGHWAPSSQDPSKQKHRANGEELRCKWVQIWDAMQEHQDAIHSCSGCWPWGMYSVQGRARGKHRTLLSTSFWKAFSVHVPSVQGQLTSDQSILPWSCREREEGCGSPARASQLKVRLCQHLQQLHCQLWQSCLCDLTAVTCSAFLCPEFLKYTHGVPMPPPRAHGVALLKWTGGLGDQKGRKLWSWFLYFLEELSRNCVAVHLDLRIECLEKGHILGIKG